MQKLFVVVAFGSVFACGGLKLTTRGALVKVAEKSTLHADCKPIRELKVQARSPENAEILLRNQAGSLAADKVVIFDRADVPDGVVIEGEAYGCPSGV